MIIFEIKIQVNFIIKHSTFISHKNLKLNQSIGGGGGGEGISLQAEHYTK